MPFPKQRFLLSLFLTAAVFSSRGQALPGFTAATVFNEQELTIKDWHNVTIYINAPLQLKVKRKTFVVIFALPNGNSIEWTKGKKMKAGDDWHYDIQHIAAQTRYVRDLDKKNNYIVAYMMAVQKAGPPGNAARLIH